MTDEARAKISATLMGHTFSPESRAKSSASHMGITHSMSLEARAKMSAARMGHVESPETRAKQSMIRIGRVMPPETRAKISVANLNPSSEIRAKMSAGHWKGGRKVSKSKTSAKRRTLGFDPLNESFAGCAAHHVDRDRVIHIPQKLHRSVSHDQNIGRGMAAINAVAYNFLLKQEVEAAFEALEARAA